MSPRIPADSLYEISLKVVTQRLLEYIERKVKKINFFNDYEAAAQEFLSRCQEGREFIDDYFIGPLR